MKGQGVLIRALRVAVGAALALAALSVASAGAAKPVPYPTQVVYLGSKASGGNTVLMGRVQSPTAACIEGRVVKVFAHHSDGSKKLLDSDHTSGAGFWGATFKASAAATADRLIIQVTKHRVGGGKTAKVCLPGSKNLT